MHGSNASDETVVSDMLLKGLDKTFGRRSLYNYILKCEK